MATAARSFESPMTPAIIQGREVPFPVIVRDACSASATYVVDAKAARAMLPGSELDVVEIAPGRALFSLACIDYRDNDLGDYNEVSLAFFVRDRRAPRGIPYLGTVLDFLRSRVSTYIVWLPVDQAFTREAGEKMWGFPKTIETIDFSHDGPVASCTLRSQGKHVLTFSAPRSGTRALPSSTMTTYTHMDGRAHATSFVSEATGVGFAVSGSTLVLGDHPMSEKLRSLGLPKRPMMTVWMEHMRARFNPPVEMGSGTFLRKGA